MNFNVEEWQLNHLDAASRLPNIIFGEKPFRFTVDQQKISIIESESTFHFSHNQGRRYNSKIVASRIIIVLKDVNQQVYFLRGL